MSTLVPVIRNLVLMLTNRCNLSCLYCYHPGTAAGIDMTPEIMQRAVDITALHGMEFHVQLTGGEPSLNREMIFQTVKTIHFKAPQATIALQTNATLLDVVLVRFLKKHKVQVGISIDGPPTVHEKTRGKFREMFEGLECLESCNVPWRATVVVTAETIEHLWSLALLISRFKTARGIALDFLTRKGLAVKNSIEPATPEIVKHGVIKLLETLEMINRSSRPPIRFREADAVANSKHRHAIRAFCHACSGESLAVYPDGSVYPCSQLCGEDRYYAGNVYGSIDWPRLRLQSSALQCDDCCSCDLHGFCPGDCPSRLAYNTKGEQCAVCALYQTIYAFQKKEQVV